MGSSLLIIFDLEFVNLIIIIASSFILNSILIEVASMLKTEKIFPFYISSNMPNATINNNKLENKFRKINPHL